MSASEDRYFEGSESCSFILCLLVKIDILKEVRVDLFYCLLVKIDILKEVRVDLLYYVC